MFHPPPTRASASVPNTAQAAKETVHDVPVVPQARGDLVTPCGQTIHDGNIANDSFRGEPRHEVKCPLLAIPLLADGSPDWDHRCRGESINVSVEGMALVLDTNIDIPTLSILLVIQQPNGQISFAGIESCNASIIEGGHLRMGARFGGFADELLKQENITPRFDRRRLGFALTHSEELLEKWAKIGVLTPILWDKVQVCPRCHSLPRYRRGCPNCGSVHLSQEQLIHHFACAHVGRVAEFEKTGELICPKCRTRRLVVGTDYEHAAGPFRCSECHWSAPELEQVAQCLSCNLRFPIHQAHEVELRGYRAHRLDPLALFPTSGPTPLVFDGLAADGRAPLRDQQTDHVPPTLGPRPAAGAVW